LVEGERGGCQIPTWRERENVHWKGIQPPK